LCCPNNNILLATNRRGEYCVLPCGPLFPFQPEPATIFAAAEDCKVLCKRSTKTQHISHLILDRKYLYSSHHNEGSIRKWDLAANARLAKATADHIPGNLNQSYHGGHTTKRFLVYSSQLREVSCMCGHPTQISVSLSAEDHRVGATFLVEKGTTPLLLQDSGRMPMLLLCMGSISSGFVAANKVLFLGINAMAATPPSLREDCDREIMWSSLSINYEVGYALRRLRFNNLWEPSFGFLNFQSRRLHRVGSIQGICILGSKLRVRYGHLCDKYRELVDRGVCSYRSAF
jgi:hypothetical protein